MENMLEYRTILYWLMGREKLNEQLGSTIFQLSRLMRKEMASSSRVAHLSMLQLEVLLYLRAKKQIKMHTLSQYFHVNKSTISSHLDTLEKMRLVKRKTDVRDRRVTHILLTNRGTAILTEGLKEKNKRMSRLLTYISVRDKKTLLMIITNLLNKLKKFYDK